MSANKCKFCNGSGWYEPKNMGGMMVEPCNRCDAHKKNQAAQKPSADVCPVCGSGEITAYVNIEGEKKRSLDCGYGVGALGCEHAERLAIERAAEIERLKEAMARLQAMLSEAHSEYVHQWTDRRAFQLSSNLGGLIRACQQIDRASGIIDRLTLIQNLADSLALADLQKGEPSFLEFLNQLCRDDRRNQSNQET